MPDQFLHDETGIIGFASGVIISGSMGERAVVSGSIASGSI